MKKENNIFGFKKSNHFNELQKSLSFQTGIRVLINAPSGEMFNPKNQTHLIFYALPRDKTIEHTIGKKMKFGTDPNFNIQHIGAQTRRLREIIKGKNILVVYLQPESLSWTAWKENYKNDIYMIKKVVENISEQFSDYDSRLTLSGHSAGGNFILGYIECVEVIPRYIERITFIDSNYSYTNEKKHGEKILEWLNHDSQHFLSIIAYDDRKVKVDGRSIIGPGEGTYRKTYEMLGFFEKDIKFIKINNEVFTQYKGLNGQIDIIIHNNRENIMLHTVLVGEKNGFIHSITTGTEYENKAAEFNGPNTYIKWIQDY